MPVARADVVDLISHNPKTNEVTLIMVEARDRNLAPEAVHQLDAKLAGYTEFILSGTLTRQYPEYANCPVCIRLDHFSPVPTDVASVLREWAGKLSTIPVSVWTCRHSWNRVTEMFRWLMRRLTDCDRRLVGWTDAAGSNRGLLTAARFTEEFSNALRKAVPVVQVHVVQDLEIKIVDLNGKASRGFLENAYNLFKLAPENKREIMEKFVTAIGEAKSSDDDPVDSARILPIIKAKDWPEVNANCKNGDGERSLEFYYEDYNEELIVVYAEDTPHNIRYLSLACLSAQT